MSEEVIKVYVQRQNHLCVCTLAIDHTWFWTACYEVVRKLIGRELANGQRISVDLQASNIQIVKRRSK